MTIGQQHKNFNTKESNFGTETVDNITKNIGRSGQFQEELPEETTISSVPSVGDLGITLTNPIVFNGGTGVTLSADGAEFNGGSRINQTISIGQDVSSNFKCCI